MQSDTIDLLEERITRLENLVGKFEILDQVKGLETIVEVSNKITSSTNTYPKITSALKDINVIKKYCNIDVLNEIEDDSLLTTKMDLIISESDYIKKLNQDFEKLKVLSKILDNKALNDLPKLTEKLKEISSKQAQIKDKEETLTNDLREFLSVYYNSITSVDDTMNSINEYLDQFDKVLPKQETEE